MGLRYNPQTGEFEDDSSDWENYNYDFGKFSGDDTLDLQNLPVTTANYSYADEYDKGFGGAKQEGSDAIPAEGVELYPGWTGTGFTGLINALKRAGGGKELFGKGLDFATSKTGIAALAGLLAYLDRQKPKRIGGGTTQGYAGPSQALTRTMVGGKYGPIATYAAQGGLMQAYANGGAVQPFPMQDGGFVMTGDAVSGAGGQNGLKQLIPEAQAILGPGTKTSDSIPAYIEGRNGTTPAKVSNGEAYIPPGRDTQGLYALMQRLERNA